MGGGWYRFIRWVATQIFRLTGGIRSVGSENVPPHGPTLLAPIHLSFLDPPAVACGTRRQLRFMAKEELFRIPLLKSLILSLGAFPVKRGEGDTESIRRTLALLEAGEAVLIFPEGTRGDGEVLQPINRGVTMLAKRTGAQVVPVAIVGSNVVLPKHGKRRRCRITLAYGVPFRYTDTAVQADEKLNRDAFAERLSRELVALANANGSAIRIAG